MHASVNELSVSNKCFYLLCLLRAGLRLSDVLIVPVMTFLVMLEPPKSHL